MKKRLIFVLAGIYLGATGAFAQIAAPKLVPDIVSNNPAAMQWTGKSQFAVGGFTLAVEETDTSVVPNTTDSINVSVYNLGFRGVGEIASAGVQWGPISGSDSNGGTNTGSFYAAAVATQVYDMFAIGVGQSRRDLMWDGVAGGVSLLIDNDKYERTVGVSMNFGDILYIGAVMGQELYIQSWSYADFPALNTQSEVRRPVKAFGIALHDTEDVMWHIEYDVATGDYVKDATTGLSNDAYETRTITLEFNLGGLYLAGASESNTETDNSTSPSTSTSGTTTSFSVGWAPEEGWSVIVSKETEIEESADSYYEENTTSLDVLYRF